MNPIRNILLAAALLSAGGCATSYGWRPQVPESRRTVVVPTFRNESNVTELGSVMARQVLREFQREGTFRLAAAGDAALEVQGTVLGASATSELYDRRSGLRVHGGEMSADVLVSVVDKLDGKVVVDNRKYTARATYASGQDHDTALRDASGRLADDLSRQVVDDVLNLKW